MEEEESWVYGADFLGSGAVMAVNTGKCQTDEVNQATPIVTSVSTENTDSTNQAASDSKPVTDSQKQQLVKRHSQLSLRQTLIQAQVMIRM